MDASAKALFSDQEDIVHRHPFLHRIVRALAHNSGLGLDHRGTSANMCAQRARPSSLGDWNSMQHRALGYRVCFDLAVRAPCHFFRG
jgi:hypothetical protein